MPSIPSFGHDRRKDKKVFQKVQTSISSSLNILSYTQPLLRTMPDEHLIFDKLIKAQASGHVREKERECVSYGATYAKHFRSQPSTCSPLDVLKGVWQQNSALEESWKYQSIIWEYYRFVCVYIYTSCVKGYSSLQRPFGEKWRDPTRKREREHMSGGVQSLWYYHMKDLLSLWAAERLY